MKVGDKVFWNTENGKIRAIVNDPPSCARFSFNRSAGDDDPFPETFDGPTLVEIKIEDKPNIGHLVVVNMSELESRQD
jgi:hypothetical protein